MKKNQTTAILAIAAGLFSVASFIDAARTIRAEQKKREKIRAWRDERLACISNSKARLYAVANEEPFSAEKFWHAYAEEKQFMEIIMNEPMY